MGGCLCTSDMNSRDKNNIRNVQPKIDLHKLVHEDDIEGLENALAEDPRPNIEMVEGMFGRTPLFLAVYYNRLEVFRHLIYDWKANVNCVDFNGWRPLHLACSLGKTNMAQILIRNGADVNAVTRQEGDTALHLAAINGHTLAVELLSREVSTLNPLNKNHNTPLQEAKKKNNKSVMQLLRAKGALTPSKSRSRKVQSSYEDKNTFKSKTNSITSI
mmetsp:Transcript_28648/g.50437  ORF Transcript_28648/g.50437 Transcript_28648/m.50437 type:complete len:216 (+) Transcript_28648:352-999(+)